MISEFLYSHRSDCSGCTACQSACPVKAITMWADEDGFTYPQIDSEKCVHCNLCKKVCSYQNELPDSSQKDVYVAVSQNTDVSTSASGGVFSSFAKTFIDQSGIVYGCAMLCDDNLLTVKHIRVDNEKDLSLLKGSKYVQSNMQGVYPQVLEDLKNGRQVLFSGTPCQVAGLKGFLQKDYENLYTIDLICHGVPSSQLFSKYIAFEESKHNSKITAFKFRDKKQGWKLHGSMQLENGRTVYFDPEESSYYQMFLNSYTYRENCYSCPYASDHRPGDITIGDYWCVELVHPELMTENNGQIEHEKGVSCTIANNEKGQALLTEFGNGIKRWNSSYTNASKYNRQLTAASAMKDERQIVLNLARESYAKLDKWYRKRLIPIKIKRGLRRAVPRPVKNIVKKVLKK